jgi:signal transduction histidine kinase
MMQKMKVAQHVLSKIKMEENNSIQHIPFTVDAGIINRLGYELVGRAETAVSELIKNAYDADANLVTVRFMDTDAAGGTLIIDDDGSGMNFQQLINGFMRIATADKVNTAVSPKYKRKRAGQKGIGRFATHRLGEKLTIFTNTELEPKALKLTIDWNQYQKDMTIDKIVNPLTVVEKTKPFGTTLIIEQLRDSWSKSAIDRVFRYVTELLQPDYLTTDSQKLNLARSGANIFEVLFEKITNQQSEKIADINKTYFEKAIAVIEGYVDEVGDGYYGVTSKRFGVEDYAEPIEYRKEKRFKIIKNIHFKAYYFIYNFNKIEDYYLNFSKQELTRVQTLSRESGGIYLYRNGFRVLPYGEQANDWLGIDKKGSARGGMYAPFSNNNFFGFVQVIEPEKPTFEETASREGLIETEAFDELTFFVREALDSATNRVHAARFKEQEENRKLKKDQVENDKIVQQKIKDIKEKVSELETLIPKTKENEAATELIKSIKHDFNTTSNIFEAELTALINENNMLRILAGLGLMIGEFTHEVGQFTPAIKGILHQLKTKMEDESTKPLFQKLERTFKRFFAYSEYFDKSVKRNISRALEPVDLKILVGDFLEIVQKEQDENRMTIEIEFFGTDLYTIPMHPSEWMAILFNFYTNAKKAIKRKGDLGKIKIVVERIDKKPLLAVEFMDNGDGIPPQNRTRIFDAFFSTSSPNGFDAPKEQALLGSGLGLKIVKDIIENYKGNISVIGAESGYNTCFRIEIAEATENQKKQYGKD